MTVPYDPRIEWAREDAEEARLSQEPSAEQERAWDEQYDGTSLSA